MISIYKLDSVTSLTSPRLTAGTSYLGVGRGHDKVQMMVSSHMMLLDTTSLHCGVDGFYPWDMAVDRRA